MANHRSMCVFIKVYSLMFPICFEFSLVHEKTNWKFLSCHKLIVLLSSTHVATLIVIHIFSYLFDSNYLDLQLHSTTLPLFFHYLLFFHSMFDANEILELFEQLRQNQPIERIRCGSGSISSVLDIWLVICNHLMDFVSIYWVGMNSHFFWF